MTKSVYAVVFSPDGRVLATAIGDGTVRLWDPTTHQPIGEPLTGRHGLVAFSPDGHVLATASSHDTVQLWNPTTHQPIGEPLNHQGRVSAIGFSPDSTILATASKDANASTVRMWTTCVPAASSPPDAEPTP
ncbi:hypothetical protein GCM10011579_067750 [Streptomyces albiflavescens]|uniref:Uncharacterized protein n=1 Tax=Streptomyces albiflavescens TaxID=1623582 RepID=A0A917YAY2_9ACTN|nr:hypothetical protein [Streptomyces albiflavescens]GGN81322.1 hypothetical protein GCM10011579_067750 [Streptomyces albiflavescens]